VLAAAARQTENEDHRRARPERAPRVSNQALCSTETSVTLRPSAVAAVATLR
jgi:hypothetical protein